MKRRVVLGEFAQAEIANAHNWFRIYSLAQAQRWMEAVDVAIENAVAFPLSGGVVARDGALELRRVVVKKFPYHLFYFVAVSEDETTQEPLEVIHFLGLRHQRQGEANWNERLSGHPFQSS